MLHKLANEVPVNPDAAAEFDLLLELLRQRKIAEVVAALKTTPHVQHNRAAQNLLNSTGTALMETNPVVAMQLQLAAGELYWPYWQARAERCFKEGDWETGVAMFNTLRVPVPADFFLESVRKLVEEKTAAKARCCMRQFLFGSRAQWTARPRRCPEQHQAIAWSIIECLLQEGDPGTPILAIEYCRELGLDPAANQPLLRTFIEAELRQSTPTRQLSALLALARAAKITPTAAMKHGFETRARAYLEPTDGYPLGDQGIDTGFGGLALSGGKMAEVEEKMRKAPALSPARKIKVYLAAALADGLETVQTKILAEMAKLKAEDPQDVQVAIEVFRICSYEFPVSILEKLLGNRSIQWNTLATACDALRPNTCCHANIVTAAGNIRDVVGMAILEATGSTGINDLTARLKRRLQQATLINITHVVQFCDFIGKIPSEIFDDLKALIAERIAEYGKLATVPATELPQNTAAKLGMLTRLCHLDPSLIDREQLQILAKAMVTLNKRGAALDVYRVLASTPSTPAETAEV